MNVIIRLQNLPWSAHSFDIRQFFHGLSIPEGGVHIVGGDVGDAFIAFSTDEDARQAMMMDGKILKGEKVRLLLSSRSQMLQVIEEARKESLGPSGPRQMPSHVGPVGVPVPPVVSMQGRMPGPPDFPGLLSAQMPQMMPGLLGKMHLPNNPEQLAAFMSQMASMQGLPGVMDSMPPLAGLAPHVVMTQMGKSGSPSSQHAEDVDSRVDMNESKDSKDAKDKRRDRKDRSRSRERNRSRDRNRDRKRSHRSRSRDRSRDRGRGRRRSRSRSRERRRSRDRKEETKPPQQPLLKTPEVGPDGKWTNQSTTIAASRTDQDTRTINSSAAVSTAPGIPSVPVLPTVPNLPSLSDLASLVPALNNISALTMPAVRMVAPQQMVVANQDDLIRYPSPGSNMPPGQDIRMRDHWSGPREALGFKPNLDGAEVSDGDHRMDMFGDFRREEPSDSNGPGRPFGMMDNARRRMMMMDQERGVGMMDMDRRRPDDMDQGRMRMMGPDLDRGGFGRDRGRGMGRGGGNRNGFGVNSGPMGQMDFMNREGGGSMDRGMYAMDGGRGPPQRAGPGFMDRPGPGLLDKPVMLDGSAPVPGRGLMDGGMGGRGRMDFGPRGGSMRRGGGHMGRGGPGLLDRDRQMRNMNGPGPRFNKPFEPIDMELDEDSQEGRSNMDKQDRSLDRGGDRFDRSHDRDRSERDRFDRDRRGRDRDRDRDRRSRERDRRSGRNDRGSRRGDDKRTFGKDEFGRDLETRYRKDREVEPDLCVEIRNLQTNTGYADLRRFFSGLVIPGTGLKLPHNEDGNRAGVAYVRFASKRDREAAINLSGSKLKNEAVQISAISDEVFDNAVDGIALQSEMSKSQNEMKSDQLDMNIIDSPCVRFEQVPLNTNADDISNLLPDYLFEIAFGPPEGNGNCKSAFLKFRQKEDAKRLLLSTPKLNVNGFEVRLSSCSDRIFEEVQCSQNGSPVENERQSEQDGGFHDRVREDAPIQPLNTECLILKNLPPNVRDRDILDFFSDVGLVPVKINLLFDAYGNSSGKAFCEFENGMDAAKGLRKDSNHMGKFIVNVHAVSRSDVMNHMLGGGQENHGPPTGGQMGSLLGTPMSGPMHGGLMGQGGPRHPFNMMHPRMMGPGLGPGQTPSGPGSGPGPRTMGLLGQGPRPFGGMQDMPVEGFGKPGCVIACENIPFRAEIDDILEHFRGYGLTKECIIRRFNDRGLPTGDARLAFNSPQDAENAFNNLRGSAIMGRSIFMRIL